MADRKTYDKRLAEMVSEQSSWRSHWRELADYILPRRQRLLSDNYTGGSSSSASAGGQARQSNRGTRRNQKIINNTATLALGTLAGNMAGYITSPNRVWFNLLHPNPDLNELSDVKYWLSHVEERMRMLMARSNFYRALSGLYRDLGCYLTAAILIEDDDEDIIRAHVLPIGSYYIANDHTGRVNTLYRVIEMTVRQIVERFSVPDDAKVAGAPNLSQTVKSMWRERNWESRLAVVHVIEPNDQRKAGRDDASGMAWRSAWYEHAGSTSDPLLSIGGFRQRPFMVPRWDVTGEDVYGSSGPGMDALGDIMQLQKSEKLWLKGLEKIVDPPMVGPASLRQQRASILPGDLTYMSDGQGGNQKYEPAHLVDARVIAITGEIQRLEGRIRSAFYTDLFLMFANLQGPPARTATEIQERHEEKLLNLGPVLEGLQDDLLDPSIDRIFGLMDSNGLLPPPPDQLQGVELRVEHVSFMARAQKMASTGGIQMLVQMAQAIGEVPTHDKLNTDQVMDDYAELIGTSPKLLRSDDEVDALRKGRQEDAEKQLAQAQAANQAAGAAKQLSETRFQGMSALDALAGRGGPREAPAA